MSRTTAKLLLCTLLLSFNPLIVLSQVGGSAEKKFRSDVDKNKERDRLLKIIKKSDERYKAARAKGIPLTESEIAKNKASEVYFREINKRLRLTENNVYPKPLVEYEKYVSVVVSFQIDRNGELMSASIVRASSSDFINEFALDLVKSASPFPLYPEEFNDPKVDIRVVIREIHFNSNRRNIQK